MRTANRRSYDIIRDVRFELRYALRSIFSRRGGLTRLSAISAVLGIAVGVASLMIVQAIYNGFRKGIEEKLLAQTAHITITANSGGSAGGNVVEAAIRTSENVSGVERALFRSAVVSSDGRGAYALVSVLLDQEQAGVEIGNELARRLGVSEKEQISILLAGSSGEMNTGEMEVTAVVDTGIYEYNSSLLRVGVKEFATLTSSKSLIPNAYLVTLTEPFGADATGNQLRERLGPGYDVVDWISANRPLFAALSTERRIAAFVFLLMICVSAIGIAATLLLLANERRLELAILKACGARSRSLGIMFLAEGLAIGLLGVAIGLGLGLTISAVANRYGFVKLSPAVYSIAALELTPDVWSAVWISAGATGLTLAAILAPVVRVSRVRPVDILRSL